MSATELKTHIDNQGFLTMYLQNLRNQFAGVGLIGRRFLAKCVDPEYLVRVGLPFPFCDDMADLVWEVYRQAGMSYTGAQPWGFFQSD